MILERIIAFWVFNSLKFNNSHKSHNFTDIYQNIFKVTTLSIDTPIILRVIMNHLKFQLVSTFVLLLLYSSSTLASANGIVDKNSAKVATIEKIIRQNIALGRLKNTFYHPIITNKVSRPTKNPFVYMPKKTADLLAKQGINISSLSRYKAIYFNGEYLGANSRKVVNTAPDTVLVIGKGTEVHDVIYSRGPVISYAKPEALAGIVSSNIVWFHGATREVLPNYSPFIGMPIVNARDNPAVTIASQNDFNKIIRERQGECKFYADTAVKQQAQNRSLACGFKGIRWSNQWKRQFDWCMTVLAPYSRVETDFREDSIKRCKVKKSSASNPKNRPAIPALCEDPSKQFQAVKQVNHSFRYDRSLKSPVSNGLIRYDYNKDKKQDFVFLETKEETARVVACLSQGNTYQRRVTDVSFTTSSFSSGFTDDFSLSQASDILTLSIDFFEHNGGSSRRTTDYRFDTATRKFKIISNKADSYGVEMDGYTFPMAVPETYKLF